MQPPATHTAHPGRWPQWCHSFVRPLQAVLNSGLLSPPLAALLADGFDVSPTSAVGAALRAHLRALHGGGRAAASTQVQARSRCPQRSRLSATAKPIRNGQAYPQRPSLSATAKPIRNGQAYLQRPSLSVTAKLIVQAAPDGAGLGAGGAGGADAQGTVPLGGASM